MSTSELSSILSQLQASTPPSPEKIASLLSSAKRQLLQLNALLPTPSTSPKVLSLARQTLEVGTILSIRLQNPDAFTRYFQQLAPFYELPSSSYSPQDDGQRNKVTGLYLLLLLTKGDYAEFHTVLEGLEVEFAAAGKAGLEEDRFIGYPVKLERWLMEGSYDRVWKATGRESVPGEEFGVFSEVRDPSLAGEDCVALHGTARNFTDTHAVKRFLSVRYARRSHPAPKRHTRHYPLPMPRTYSSWTAKAASLTLPGAEDGRSRTGGYTFPCNRARI